MSLKKEISWVGNTMDTEAVFKEITWCMGPIPEFDYNLTLCPLQSRLQHIYHRQPRSQSRPESYAISRLYPPVRDLEFGLWEAYFCSIIMTEIGKGENESIHLLENVCRV